MNFICRIFSNSSNIFELAQNHSTEGKNNHRHRPLIVIVKGNIESDTLAEAIKGVLMAGSVINWAEVLDCFAF